MGWGLRPVSAKRQAEEAERREVCRRVRQRDGNRCRARDVMTEVRCSGPLDVHEIIPRSAWKGGYLVDENCIVVCRGHHDWIGANPEEAHGHGLHGYSWERPDA